jgi:hypothetical protein
MKKSTLSTTVEASRTNEISAPDSMICMLLDYFGFSAG